MATNGHFYWPSVGSYVAAYGQFFMAANKWAEYAERSAQRTVEDWSRAAETMRGIPDIFMRARQEGVAPGSSTANQIAEVHRAALGEYFYCTHSMHVMIADMYASEDRFAEYFDGLRPGLAIWIREIIHANALAHGIEPSTATWA